MLLVFGAVAGGWLLRSAADGHEARAEDAPKPAVKWEYCYLSNGHKGQCALTTAREVTPAENWTELAKKLKAPLKEGVGDASVSRVAVFDFLGSQGWELVSHTIISMNSAYVEQYAFKRRADK
jgi:hypothetical protein